MTYFLCNYKKLNKRSYSQKVMLSIYSIFKLTFNKDGLEKKTENTCICIHQATHF